MMYPPHNCMLEEKFLFEEKKYILDNELKRIKSGEQKRRWANSAKFFMSNCNRSANISNTPYNVWWRDGNEFANWMIETIWELSVRWVGSVNVSQSNPTNGKCEPTSHREHYKQKINKLIIENKIFTNF
jgi:hypothetical protein